MNDRDGFSVVALLAFAGALVVAGSLYLSFSNECLMPWSTLRCIGADEVRPVACTEEARICPDGSAVARTGPKCEFAPCPTLRQFNGNECAAQGGEVVNTLHFQGGTPPDYAPEEVLGEIVGTKCPCVCVKRAAGDDRMVIAQLERFWPSLQQSIEARPVLGASAWHLTAIQFIGGDRILVAAEDGHAQVLMVYQYRQNVERSFFQFSDVHEVGAYDRYDGSAASWRALIQRYGDPQAESRTYVTSVVRDGEVVTFSGWTEVPENPFSARLP